MGSRDKYDSLLPTPYSLMKVPAGITLGQALKAAALAGTGGEAKVLVQMGEVTVNGEVETRRGRRLREDDIVEVGEERLEVSGS